MVRVLLNSCFLSFHLFLSSLIFMVECLDLLHVSSTLGECSFKAKSPFVPFIQERSHINPTLSTSNTSPDTSRSNISTLSTLITFYNTSHMMSLKLLLTRTFMFPSQDQLYKLVVQRVFSMYNSKGDKSNLTSSKNNSNHLSQG